MDPKTLLEIQMIAHQILTQQINQLKEIVTRLEMLREDLMPLTLDQAEELWDDIDVEHLKNADNLSDFIHIVKAIQYYFNIGERK